MKPRGNIDDVIILTEWLDTKISIDGIPIKFGLDFIVGLIPVVGDFATTGVSLYSLWRYRQEGAKGELLLKMTGNILIDTLVGLIPFVGDLFDLGFKANHRNLQLWFEYKKNGKHKGQGILLLSGIIVSMILLMVFFIISCIGILVFLLQLLSNQI